MEARKIGMQRGYLYCRHRYVPKKWQGAKDIFSEWFEKQKASQMLDLRNLIELANTNYAFQKFISQYYGGVLQGIEKYLEELQ